MRRALTGLAAMIIALVGAAPAVAQSSMVTYQGRLSDGGTPANGSYDMRFSLYDDLTPGADVQIGSTLTHFAVPVADGLFSVVLNFGPTEFDGSGPRFLEVEVSPFGAGTYSALAPRHEITSAPQADHAIIATTATNLTLPFSGASGTPVFAGGPVFNITNGGAAGYGIYGTGPDGGIIGWGGPFVSGFPAIPTGSGLVGISDTSGVTGTSTSGQGVTGRSAAGTGGEFENRNNSATEYGLHAFSNFGSTAGLFEINLASSARPALIARTNSTQGNAQGILAVIESSSPGGFSAAVRGVNAGTTGNGIGVYGTQDGNGWGVFGKTFGGVGVYGASAGTGFAGFNAGIRGEGTEGAMAGYFVGNVHIAGTLSKTAGTFRIDHPQDPENRTLSHSFVESPEMKNIYDGLITTDADGFATVTLPGYFDALNTSFRYQLTVLDSSDEFVLSKVTHQIGSDSTGPNAFSIRTSKPNILVSWQVTGVRDDPWAQQNPISVEAEKSDADKGRYLNPEAYHKPREQGIGYLAEPPQPNPDR